MTQSSHTVSHQLPNLSPNTVLLPHMLHSQNLDPRDLLPHPSGQPLMSSASGRVFEDDEGQARLFACPFYKFNPALCDQCKKFKFPRVSDMKQHLIRCHSLCEPSSFSCTRCHQAFTNEQSMMLHLDDGLCQYLAAPEKLSLEEVEKLKGTKYSRGYDGVRQWYGIWSQLFPGHEEPLSPYKEPNNIKEAISLISPTLVAHLHAAFPLALPLPIVQTIMDRAYLDFCNNLPRSRCRPFVRHPGLPVSGHNQCEGMKTLGLILPQPETTSYGAVTMRGPLLVENTPTGMGYDLGSDLGLSASTVVNDAGPNYSSLLKGCISPLANGGSIREFDVPAPGEYVVDEVYDWIWEADQ